MIRPNIRQNVGQKNSPTKLTIIIRAKRIKLSVLENPSFKLKTLLELSALPYM